MYQVRNNRCLLIYYFDHCVCVCGCLQNNTEKHNITSIHSRQHCSRLPSVNPTQTKHNKNDPPSLHTTPESHHNHHHPTTPKLAYPTPSFRFLRELVLFVCANFCIVYIVSFSSCMCVYLYNKYPIYISNYSLLHMKIPMHIINNNMSKFDRPIRPQLCPHTIFDEHRIVGTSLYTSRIYLQFIYFFSVRLSSLRTNCA